MKPASVTTTAFSKKVSELEKTVEAVKLTPGHGVAGRHATRSLLDALSGNKEPGMFGRMFPKLAAGGIRRQASGAWQCDARRQSGRCGWRQSPHPSGYTYFGQFVDHDISLDLTSLGDKEKDPLGIENFRTQSIDLDCVYGLGKEAKVRGDGLRLGPVGSTIISGVFVGLVHGDQNSFLWQVKNWKPNGVPSEKAGQFTMVVWIAFRPCQSTPVEGGRARLIQRIFLAGLS
ncbi:MAG: hypothetical protein MEQ84_03400 [Mesorhizobium sp.]|nr:hypothetical protein [Mesorhizobium sp.]